MKKAACIWCNSIVTVKDRYDDLQHAVVCSQSCEDAETLFNLWLSDESHNRRVHYKELTNGQEEETQSQPRK